MKVIRISEVGTQEAVSQASQVIEGGGIVAFPTETFYGLGVKYNHIGALTRLYGMKQRPKKKAIPLIIGDRKSLPLISSSVSSMAERLMTRFWPGPLTILFRAREGLSEFVTAGTGKVAVRIPGESFALDLARSLEFPVTATSANISGAPSADSADEVIRYFQSGLDLLIDGGKTPGGEPSTIIDSTGKEILILRQGAVSAEEIMDFVSQQRRQKISNV